MFLVLVAVYVTASVAIGRYVYRNVDSPEPVEDAAFAMLIWPFGILAVVVHRVAVVLVATWNKRR